MNFRTNAIYEQGVLRPLTPLDLDENQVVSVAISAPDDEKGAMGEVAQQQRILADYLAKVESRPDPSIDEDFTNRDHDRLIYGGGE